MTIIENRKQNNRNLMLHILCWALLFVVPLFFHGSDESWTMVWNRYMRGLGATVSYLLVFYLNYLWIVPRFMLKKKDWKMFLLINVLVLVVGLLAVDLWHVIIDNFMPELNNRGPKMSGRYFSKLPRYFYGSLVNILFIALAVAVRMYQRWQHLEEARKEAEAARAEAELSNLRNQMNPHFLLNTLNNIYALIAFNQEKAQTAVGELSKLLRHVLYENQQDFVPLCKEADFMRNYIELMKIRVTDNVKIVENINVQPDDSTPVAPLLFISLLENAFKHGISPQGAGEINISLSQAGGEITCEITNTHFPKRENDKSGSGIGLEQVSRRLELMYPDRYTWEKGVTPDGKEYYSKITIKKEES
ncbi:MAG: histidine kinase [Muribaculaceae bacterium]|nr:histidine kinase [Muribaculaceae bacterium]